MRVLVVDDDDGIRALVRLMLEERGHEAEEAADGPEALVAFRDRGADVVLCDMSMPGMDGPEVVRELRRASPGVRVVAMTAGSPQELLEAGRLLGAAATLSKPFMQEDLLAAVHRGLTHPAS